MDAIQKRILEEVADLHDVPIGAYTIRANGKTAAILKLPLKRTEAVLIYA